MTADLEVFRPAEPPDLLGTAPADLVPEDLVERGEIPQASEDEARERAEWIRANLPTYVEVRAKIAEARARRDWLALGYPTWFAYVSTEFDPAHWNLPRKDRRELVVESLRADPVLSDVAHANRTGATDKTVAKVRHELEATSEIPRLEARVGDDGKERRAPEPVVPPAETPKAEESKSESSTSDTPKAEEKPVEQHEERKHRKPLPDAFRTNTYDLVKVLERLERLIADDRFSRNAEQVARTCRGDLLRATELLTTVVGRIPTLNEEGN